MDSRIKDTIVRHDKGFNCAQAVACTYCDLLGYKEEDIFHDRRIWCRNGWNAGNLWCFVGSSAFGRT